jgi:hypothetical protein
MYIFKTDILINETWFHTSLKFFGHENGGDMFLRNVGLLSTDYMTLYIRRKNTTRYHQFIEILRLIIMLKEAPIGFCPQPTFIPFLENLF